MEPEPEFEVQLPLGVVRRATPCNAWLITAQQLVECLDFWRTQPWPELYSVGKRAEPGRHAESGTLCFQVGTERAGFAFPASCAQRRSVKSHYFDLWPNLVCPSFPNLDELLGCCNNNKGKDVLIVAREPLGRDALRLAACASVRGERVFLLDCDVHVVLHSLPELCAPEPEPCLTHVTLTAVDPRVSMAQVPRSSLVERVAVERVAERVSLEPTSKFLAWATSAPFVSQLDLVQGYLELAENASWDFAEVHEALKFTRVRYPPGFQDLDELGNDPVPSFVLADNSLCVGGLHHARLELLRLLGIGHVVSAGATELDELLRAAGVDVLSLPDLPDDHATSALEYFDAVVSFVRVQRLLGRPVLVHCHRGMSRGPTLVMAYLVSEFGMTAQQARRAVQRVRPRARPSLRFLDDLQRWELRCLGRRETLCLRP
jgi:protein-tyrosine phosphatase